MKKPRVVGAHFEHVGELVAPNFKLGHTIPKFGLQHKCEVSVLVVSISTVESMYCYEDHPSFIFSTLTCFHYQETSFDLNTKTNEVNLLQCL